MRTVIVTLVLSLAPLYAVACNKDEPAPQPSANTAAPSADPAKHAHAGVTPGSYEDWCGEHQVPESQCTRCNPSLIAAFKATGDWCAEHGLPESQCLICNPDLKIQRPPKPEGAK
jgi:hypothetical protein